MGLFATAHEVLLVDRIKELKYTPANFVVVQFNLSKLNEKKIDNEALVNFIKQSANDPKCEVFSCIDNDIFILIEKIKNSIMQKIIQDMKSKFASDPLVANDSAFFRLIDLAIGYDSFSAICNEKLFLYKKFKDAKNGLVTDSSNHNLVARSTRIDYEFEVATWNNALASRKSRRLKTGFDSLNILIVEDDQFVRQVMKTIVGADYQTVAVRDGVEAVKAYMTNAPDIVFLDIELPDTSGFEFLENITRQDSGSFIVMTSANNSSDIVRLTLSKGAKGYVIKPFTKAKFDQYVALYNKVTNRKPIE